MGWIPNATTYRGNNSLLIKLELSGHPLDSLTISARRKHLTVNGSRLDRDAEAGSRILQDKIGFGAFSNSFDIPEGYDVFKATASLRNGFLRITVPRQKDGEPAEARAAPATPAMAR